MVPSWRSFRKKFLSCFNIAVISLVISSLHPVEGFAITNSGDLGLFQIPEEQPIGTVVITVKTDQLADSFKLTDTAGYFGINSTTGEVFIQKRIDKEVIGSSRPTATVTARKDSFTATANLKCVVKDINDVTPSFPKRFYNVSISEKTSVGNVAYTVKAVDAETGTNGQQFVTYAITSGNEDGSFSITQYSGEVKVSRDLDYETKTHYTLNITARDKPGLSNWTILQVTVLDADDLPAKFTSFIYTAEVSEDASLGTSILQVVAFDLDKGINSTVTYGIDQETNPSRLFVINNVTGLISLNGSLDRESLAEYSIRVLAYSSYPVTDHATVDIKVTDANDNIPVFTQSVYQGSVLENLAAGASVLKVEATDKDQGINAELRYHINPSTDANRFSIDHQTGSVTTAVELDREEKNLYNLTVVVEDMNGNGTMGNVFNNTANVYVHVQDANDNAPAFTFSPSYNVTINESIAIGAKVIQVEAKDPDVDQDIAYAITGGNDLQRFLIGRRSGIIYVRSVIDRDPPLNETSFTLEVMAIDNNNHLLNSTATVTVAVDDVNDNHPHCSQDQYSASVYENATEGTTVMSLVCSDVDTGDNARLTYKLVSGADKKFGIRSTSGIVHTIDALDYDNGNKTYKLSLLVTDNGTPPLRKEISLNIDVINMNDNFPVFTKRLYDFSVLEGDYSSLVLIGEVEATDGDTDANGCLCGQIRYSIVNSTVVFSIDNVTGVVSTSSVLDREAKSVYTLVVMATDQDPWKPLSNFTTVTIHVADQNDNSPIFDQVNYTAKVGEEKGPGYQVIKVSSSDRDSGRNANISYSIVSGNIRGVFTIDEMTGQVRTAGPLDYETLNRYDLTVAAIDGGASPRQTIVSVTIDVIDANDNKPVCMNNGLTVKIRENLPAGQNVTKISVVDKDHDINQKTRYSLVSDSFDVNEDTGDVNTTRSLDRESQSNYTLTVIAYNYNQSSMTVNCTVMVVVEDDNDNTPLFNTSSHNISVSESVAIGTTLLRVTATDQDEAHNGDIRYVLMGDGTKFAVNATTGIITLTSSLDRETSPHYTFNIVARDRGLPQSRSSMAHVSITVIDVNDNTPIFDKAMYSGSIPENVVNNSIVMTVYAEDRDEGLNRDVEYSITGGNVGNTFSINSSGTIMTATPLDRETTDRYELTVTARDRGTPPLNSTVKSVITVQDVNDNAPNITNAPTQITIQENIPTGSLVYLLTADDKDIGLNTRVTFTGHAEPAGTFVINPSTGMITTVGPLDRETTQRYKFFAYATDHGSQPLNSSSVSFDIFINDLNDNNPVFNPVSYAVNISENVAIATVILRVNASEKDLGESGRIVYKFEAGDPQEYFRIDNNTGVIRSSKSLDRESIARFDLVISAKDHGSPARFGYGYVTIYIVDTNDLPPVFDMNQYSSSVKENVVTGTLVTTVIATDGDIGPNAKITYSIINGEGKLDFNITTIEEMDRESQKMRFIGQIYSSRVLDRESHASYNLTVVASDGVHNSTTQVIITLQDVNDNSPIFDVPSTVINISLPENTPGGTEILNKTARDIDEGYNARITYSVAAGDGYFYIDSNTGVLYTTPKTLDRETKDFYSLTITASDPGNNKASITVNVNISDFNDNPPRFNLSVVAVDVDEGSGVMINVTATDQDQGTNQEIEYRIISGNDGGIFQIDNKTGNLTSVKNVDRERTGLKLDQNDNGVYSLVVEAADHGQPPLSSKANVIITVKDINDNAPVFQKSLYNLEILENATIGDILGSIKADDKDAGTNGQVMYSIISTGNIIPFALNTSTGKLSVNKSLDREAVSSYDFTVQALDTGSPTLNSTAQVKVVIKDINDNKPIFGQNAYNVSIPESTPGGSEVLKLDARDTDEGSKGQVGYAILYGSQGHFIIEEWTGIIRTIGNLDYETNQSYTINVSASDSGTPSLRNSVIVFVNITDINDHAPVFNQSQYSVNISEDSPVNTSVLLVQATDFDQGTNAQISLSLVDDFGIFSIHHDTGQLTIKKQLDREEKDFFQLQVKATDHGTPSLSSTALVTIYIVDTNDLPPVFVMNQYSSSVKENVVTGTLVTTVIATDGDIGPNAKITYSIINGEGMLDFNITTIEEMDRESQKMRFIGRIYSLRDLDREARASYNLTVVASDGVHNSTTQVIITLQDVNDNSPIFDVPSTVINISLAENTPGGTEILNKTACDIDEGYNARITYSVAGDGYFYIDSNTGVLYTTPKTLDRETKDFYSLTITASDPRNNKASITVNVNISDLNDNPPRFNLSVVAVDVDEGSGVMINVTATDQDQGTNQEIEYRIISGNDGGIFQIDNKTGNLTSVKNVDRERTGLKLDQNDNGVYSLVVEAADHGQPPKSSKTNVIITVKDINDNAPVFQKSLYNFEIPENATIGDILGSIEANDKDAGTNGQVMYSIISTGIVMPFSLNTSNGKLSVNKSLDREAVSSYDFTLQASDTGSPSLNSTAQVKVVIKDINDNKPIFGQNAYNVSIPENTPGGSEVLKLDARDTDEGSKGQVGYAILDGSQGHFIIEGWTGIIRTVGSLDYETNQSYTINVSASDSGTPSLRNSVIVFVNITDINDHAPVFNKSQYSVNISEDSPVNTSVLLVQATDLDQGTNAQISFSLVDDFGFFSIHHDTGQLTIKKQLDREERDFFQLQVKAKDHGAPSLSSTALVKIIVTDVNDNTPTFSKPSFNFQTSEDAINGAILGLVMAVDRDTGDNARLNYSLTGARKDLFQINSHTGSLSLVHSATGLANQNISLLVTCRDNGRKSLSSDVNVSVFISTGSRKVPKLIPRHLNVSIYENASIGDFIVKLNGSDTANSNIDYLLLAGNHGKFSLNSTNGVLTLIGSLDRETKSSYTLFVMVQDRALPIYSDYGSVFIDVLDINDNEPAFIQKSFVLRVPENTANSSKVTQVKANDLDQGINGQVFYSLQGDASTTFFIDNRTGDVYTKTTLDYETTQSYNVTVVAENTLASVRLRSLLTFTINVEDILESRPTFSSDWLQTSIKEDAPIGSFVIDVNATLNDKISSFVFYRLVHNQSSINSQHFLVEPDLGIIRSQTQLDRETTSNYTLVVEARDLRGTNEYRATTHVKVDVLDVNDNDPVFKLQSYTFSPKETSSVGDVIGQLQARDADKDENAVTLYEISDGNQNGYFGINSNDGTIVIAKLLDFEAQPTFTLKVRAYDKNKAVSARRKRDVSSPSYSEATVTVKVQDENDNPPVFTQQVYLGSFYPETSDSAVLVTVKAIDNDSGSNSIVRYYTTNESRPGVLSLNSLTGHVIHNKSVLNDTITSYSIHVSARDNNGMSPYNTASNPVMVMVFFLTSNNAVTLAIGVPLSFVKANRQQLEDLLRNVTGQTVILKSLQQSPDDPSQTIAVVHLVNNSSMTVLNRDQATKILTDKSGELETRYPEWKIRVITVDSLNTSAKRKTEYFSFYMAAIMLFAVLIGIVGLIGLIVICRYKRREKNYHDPDSQETDLNSIDISGIGAYIESRADHVGKPKYNDGVQDGKSKHQKSTNEETDGPVQGNSRIDALTSLPPVEGGGVSAREIRGSPKIDKTTERQRSSQGNLDNTLDDNQSNSFGYFEENDGAFLNKAYNESEDGSPSDQHSQAETRDAVPSIVIVSRNPFKNINTKGYSPDAIDSEENMMAVGRGLNGRSPRRSDSYSPADYQTKNNEMLLKNGQARGTNFPERRRFSISGVYDIQKRWEQQKKKKRRRSRSPHVHFDLEDSKHPDELEWERQVSVGAGNMPTDALGLDDEDWSDAEKPLDFHTFGRSKNESKTDDSPDSSISDGDDCEVLNLEDTNSAYPPSDDENTNTYVINPDLKNLNEVPLETERVNLVS